MKKYYVTSLLMVLSFLGTIQSLNAQIIADGTYKILNTVNSQVVSINTLPVSDPNNPDGLIIGRAQMATPDSADNLQLWSFVHQGNDVYKITNVGDNTILGVKDGWCGDFGDVQVGFDANSDFTLFRVTAAVDPNSYVFEIAFDAACNFGSMNTPIKAFDIDGGNSGGKIQTFPVDGANPNQQFQIVDPASLSISNLDQVNIIDFSYNKANREVTISTLENTTISDLRVFDMSGKLIKSDSSIMSNTATVNCTTFTNGIYFINVQSQGKTTVEKIVIH